MDLASLIRDVPDFPEPGIVYKDITPLLADAAAVMAVIDELARAQEDEIDVVVGIEARGFIFAPLIAARLGVGFVPLRKAGKLPWTTVSKAYDLEYGSATMEVHADAFTSGQRALIVDDVLATGGTAAAAVDLVRTAGGTPQALAFVVELSFLNGAAKFGDLPWTSVIRF